MKSQPLTPVTRWGWRARLLHATTVLAVLGVLLPACLPTSQIGTCNGGGGRNVNLCLGFSGGTPTIDGNVQGDTAWLNAFRYILGEDNGTPVPNVVAYGMRNSSTLYLGFEVHNDQKFDVSDAIVLAFDPDGTPANRRRFHIYPVSTSGASGGGAPQKVDYWKGSDSPSWNDPNTPVTETNPAWLQVKVTSLVDAHNHYSVEIGIPIVANATDPGINLPAGTDDFGFYFSVLDAVTVNGGTNYVSELSWPTEAHVGQFLEETPAPGSWGNGTLGSLNNGVSVVDLYTNQTPNTNIELDVLNIFSAALENKMVTSGGAQATAHNVKAEFFIRNYGLGQEWVPMPHDAGTPNPTNPIDLPGATGALHVNWKLTPTQRTDYQNHPDQCMRVDITSTGPDTLIVNRRAAANMHFVDTQSPFDERARIGVRGYKPPDGRREHEFLLTEWRYNTPRAEEWQSDFSNVEPFSSGSQMRQYVMRVPTDRVEGELGARVTPPNIRIPRQIVKLAPGAAPGAEARVRVEPGGFVTVFASGSIILRKGQDGIAGAEIGPNGVALKGRGRYPLNAGDSPETRVGAVVASLDGFQSRNFPIGRAMTFEVPAGVTEIAFGINDTTEGMRLQAGEGFSLEVIHTPPAEHFRHTASFVGARLEKGIVHKLALGQNLPTWIVCGQRKTGTTLTIQGKQFERYENAGCFGSIVKSIRIQ